MISPTNHSPILLFDGNCAVCNRSVQWILRHDRRAVFYFAPLQSDLGKKMLSFHSLEYQSLDSLVLIAEDKAYIYADAIIQIGNQLGSIYLIFNILRLFPRFIRDGAYRYFAAHRYRWFGRVKEEQCVLVKAAWKGRFLG